MTAQLMDGKAVAARIHNEVAEEVKALQVSWRAPSLHVVLCNDNPASRTYIRNKKRAAEQVGIAFTLHELSDTTTTSQLLHLLAELNSDANVDAILVQDPLYPQVDTTAILPAILPTKDADGFHPFNFGVLAQGGQPIAQPCTPAGCMELLRHYRIPLAGTRAVVIGRSTIVGRPMALLLTAADATVTICHSRTQELSAICRSADILVCAIGKPRMITAEYVQPGACVIDVGITPHDGTVVGDVDRTSVEPIAGWLTPVPGGVGPMTIAMLLRNTVNLARMHRDALVSHPSVSVL